MRRRNERIHVDGLRDHLVDLASVALPVLEHPHGHLLLARRQVHMRDRGARGLEAPGSPSKSHSTVARLFGGDSTAWKDVASPTVGVAGATMKSTSGGAAVAADASASQATTASKAIVVARRTRTKQRGAGYRFCLVASTRIRARGWSQVSPGQRRSACAILPSSSAPSWIRTSGLLLRRESLYPAELSGLGVENYPGSRCRYPAEPMQGPAQCAVHERIHSTISEISPIRAVFQTST